MAEFIEREALLAWFGDYKAYDPDEHLSPQHIIDDIAEIPSADVAPVVHGRWIPFEHWVHKIYWKGKACSVCNANIGHKTAFKFCPNCGARMDGE